MWSIKTGRFQQQLLARVIEHLNEVHLKIGDDSQNLGELLAEIYTEIKEDSQTVSDFLAEIEQVTNNLNMLSVNAAVEAARAGEKGEGFSLVAEEVEELADKSSSLVENIEEVNGDIISLNDRITEVVGELEEGLN